MDTKQKLQRIFIKGGVLSPGELKQILRMTEELGLSTIKFGSRQDILIPYKASNTLKIGLCLGSFVRQVCALLVTTHWKVYPII